MCGRYASFTQAQDLADIFSIDVVSPVAATMLPSWNVAPTDPVRIIREEVTRGQGVRILDAARWGLVPSWASDPAVGSRLINARSETVAEKASFRGPLAYARCVVPAEGYYEWQAPPAGRRAKMPYYIHGDDGAPLALAGLYSLWHGELLTCSIVTRASRGELAGLHDREPVTLRPAEVDHWLDPTMRDTAEAAAILRAPRAPLRYHRVSTMVNTVRNNDPSLIEPAA